MSTLPWRLNHCGRLTRPARRENRAYVPLPQTTPRLRDAVLHVPQTSAHWSAADEIWLVVLSASSAPAPASRSQ